MVSLHLSPQFHSTPLIKHQHSLVVQPTTSTPLHTLTKHPHAFPLHSLPPPQPVCRLPDQVCHQQQHQQPAFHPSTSSKARRTHQELGDWAESRHQVQMSP
jgi:hypothetical protein